jgi:heterodisulfide reductase subunit C
MSKPKKLDINQILLKAHKLGVKQAIEKSARTNTALIVYENGKIKSIKPKFKYVRVPINSPTKKQTANSRSSQKKR